MWIKQKIIPPSLPRLWCEMQLCVCVLYVGSWNGGSVPVHVCVCVCLNVCIYDLVCTKTLKQNRRKNYLSLRMPRVCVCVLVCIDLCERMRACNKLTARVCAHTIHLNYTYTHRHTATCSSDNMFALIFAIWLYQLFQQQHFMSVVAENAFEVQLVSSWRCVFWVLVITTCPI